MEIIVWIMDWDELWIGWIWIGLDIAGSVLRSGFTTCQTIVMNSKLILCIQKALIK